MPYYNDGRHDGDITKAETPRAIFGRLLGYLRSIAESVEKVFPRVEANAGVDTHITGRLANQLDELSDAAADLAQAIRQHWGSEKQRKTDGETNGREDGKSGVKGNGK